MYSAAIAQSTMDFSIMHVDDGVVDSPPNAGKCPLSKSSPSLVRICPRSTSPGVPLQMNVVTQRKLYEEDLDVLHSPKVWALNYTFCTLMSHGVFVSLGTLIFSSSAC